MKEVINPVTKQREIQFSGRLISISPDVVGSTPNGKDYRIGTISFKNKSNQLVQASALIFENNFKYGMETGVEYQCRAVFTPNQASPLIIMSHLTGAARATFDDFGVTAEEVTAASAETKVSQ